MSTRSDESAVLDAAERLFYERGFQAVGMDALREASGLPLKRIYSLFDGKEKIAVAMLDRRDERWFASLERHVQGQRDAQARIDALFDWLFEWLAEDGYRGCAWINAFGELGGTSSDVAEVVRRHKSRLKTYVTALVRDAGGTDRDALAVFILVEGAMVTAGIEGKADAALEAKRAASALVAR